MSDDERAAHGPNALPEGFRGSVPIKDGVLQVSEAVRTHTVRRGETWHGIAKRLSGDVDPHSLLGRLQRLREINPGVHSDASGPAVGSVLNVPSEWAPMPPVDTASAAGRQRLDAIRFDEVERRDQIIKSLRQGAEEWQAVERMSGWQFIRWAWRWYWRGERPARPPAFEPYAQQ